MANKGKFFSWFGKGKKSADSQTEPADEQNSTATTNTVGSEPVNVDTDPVISEPIAEQTAEIKSPVEESVKPAPISAEIELATTLVAQSPADAAETVALDVSADLVAADPPAEPSQKAGFFSRLKQGLSKTKANLGTGIVSLFRGKKIDDDLYEALETQLLVADVGVETALKLVANLTKQADRKQLKMADALYGLLKQEMAELLVPVDKPLIPVNPDGPFVILMVGVNGVGKTTTIGKMARQFQQQGKSVMLAAGDTFRAAAVEQLTVWGERNNIPVIAQHTGADSASVIFDALQAAKSRKIDIVIADTAGRLQNKDHLMEELKKIVRVMKKLDVNAPHEVMLTLDAGTGQNALSQVKLFSEAVGLTGLTLSKLDGTAKGGIVFAIADKFSIPIRYIGVGEGIDDLRAFNSRDFIEALFTDDATTSEA